MSTTVARLEAVLSANTRDFDRAMDKSESKMGKIGKVAGVAGLAIAGGLAIGLEKSVKAALEAQVSQARLDKAFHSAHMSADKYRKGVEQVESASRRLGFTDDDVRKSLGSLLVATGSYKDSVKQLAIAQDLARFKGVSLMDATKALTMAHAGSLRALKQLGLDVPKVTDAQDKLKESTKKHSGAVYDNALAVAKLQDKHVTYAKVLDLVSEKTKGQAKAFSETAAGGMEQFRAQIQHIEEVIGGKLLPVMTQTISWVSEHWPQISKVVKESWTQIKPTLEAFMQLVVSLVTTIRQHWSTIGPIVREVATIIRAQLTIITGIIKFFAAVLRGDWSAAWDALKGIVRGVLTEIVGILRLWKSILGDVGKEVGHAIVNGVKAGLHEAEALLKDAVEGLFHKVIGWVKDVLGIKSPSTVFHDIGQNMVRGMVRGVGSMGGFLKDAVVKLAKSVPSHVLGAFSGGGTHHGGNEGGLVQKVLRALSYARQHGWQGEVTSGFRTYEEQARLYQNYLHGGPLAAPPGTSSHERGEAVDVTDYGTFGRIMARAPSYERLLNYLGARDPVHFSVSGYDRGGWLPTGLSLAYNGTGRPEAVGGGGGSVTIPVIIGGDEVARVVWDPLRRAAKVHKRRTGRSPF